MPSFSSKRRYELWQTATNAHLESLATFSKYLQPLSALKPGLEHSFLKKAERTLHRLGKLYGVRRSIKVRIAESLTHPFHLTFEPACISIESKLFNDFDEDIWSAVSVGMLQVIEDWEKGLYDEKRLIERFFQGMLLSGAPLSKLLRFWVMLSVREKLIDPSLLRSHPEQLMAELPFLNSLIIFYLSADFEQKVDECALNLG